MKGSTYEKLMLVRHIKQMRLLLVGTLQEGMALTDAAIAEKAAGISVMDPGLTIDDLVGLVDLAVRIYESEFVRNWNGTISLRK